MIVGGRDATMADRHTALSGTRSTLRLLEAKTTQILGVTSNEGAVLKGLTITWLNQRGNSIERRCTRIREEREAAWGLFRAGLTACPMVVPRYTRAPVYILLYDGRP